ncbi:hypothetical protein BSL78_26361 [Apostichopus japonicus]|uniref:Transmembrane 9 superfamily member n=1 Tax=Stichopus japonicus TaxID=307972 RepID=A0A2G8JM19_STIJA|nr:hypothetical protein BSL78_26361 [Apostichopus japonicus]
MITVRIVLSISQEKLLLLATFVSLLVDTSAFYIPGVAPVEFKENDPVDIKGVKMTSTKTQLPYEFYSIPMCEPPKDEIEHRLENLGEVLRGDRIVNTLYKVSWLQRSNRAQAGKYELPWHAMAFSSSEDLRTHNTFMSMT